MTPNTVAQFGLPPLRIDLMTSIPGVPFADAWEDRVEDSMLGVPVAFIGRDALIRNKRASGRAQDMRDVRALEGHGF